MDLREAMLLTAAGAKGLLQDTSEEETPAALNYEKEQVSGRASTRVAFQCN